MSTHRKSGQASTLPEAWPIFIAYRDDDGQKHAEWLFRNLNKRGVNGTLPEPSASPVIVPFFDKNNPPTDDFRKYNEPNLERSVALILVCTIGAVQLKPPKLGEDWLYREINWWLRRRRTCPLLIRASSKSPNIPYEIDERWPNAQWVRLDLDALESLDHEAREKKAEEIVGRIVKGIEDSRGSVVYEELERKKRLVFWLRIATVVAVVFAVTSLGLAFRFNNSRKEADAHAKRAEEAKALAESRFKIAESRRLAVLADSVRPSRLDQAMLLAYEAGIQADTIEARACLERAFDTRPEVVRFLHVPEGTVSSVVFGPQGEIVAGYNNTINGHHGGIVLFNKQGDRLRSAPLEEKEVIVSSVAFGPDGEIKAGYQGRPADTGGVVHFNAQGQRLRTIHFSLEGGSSVLGMALGPKRIAAIYGGFSEGRNRMYGNVVLFDAFGVRLPFKPLNIEEGFPNCIAFGPEGEIAAAYHTAGHYCGVVFFNAQGERTRPEPLKFEKGVINSMTFRPKGTLVAGYVGVGDTSVVLFDANGVELPSQRLNVRERTVTSLAIRAAGKIGPEYDLRDGVGVTVFDARGMGLPSTKPLEVSEGTVTSVALGPGGKIAAGYDGDGMSGVVLLNSQNDRMRSAPLKFEEGSPSSVTLGPEGKIAAAYRLKNGDAGVALFDAQGKWSLPASLVFKEGTLMNLAFGPEGKIAAAYRLKNGDAGVALIDAHGKWSLPASLVFKEGTLMNLAFGPEDKISVAYRLKKDSVRVDRFDVRGVRLSSKPLSVREGTVSSVTFGPEGKIAAAYDLENRDAGVALFDARGTRFLSKPLEFDPSNHFPISVAFGSDGRIAVGYSMDSGHSPGFVMLYSTQGDELLSAPLKFEHYVYDVAFGPKDNFAVLCSNSVVLFDASGVRLRPSPLNVKVGQMAFGPEGHIAAISGGHVEVFDADPASWRRKALETANRNFTRQEWKQFFPDMPYRRTSRSFCFPRDLTKAELRLTEDWEKEHPAEPDAP